MKFSLHIPDAMTNLLNQSEFHIVHKGLYVQLLLPFVCKSIWNKQHEYPSPDRSVNWYPTASLPSKYTRFKQGETRKKTLVLYLLAFLFLLQTFSHVLDKTTINLRIASMKEGYPCGKKKHRANDRTKTVWKKKDLWNIWINRRKKKPSRHMISPPGWLITWCNDKHAIIIEGTRYYFIIDEKERSTCSMLRISWA